MVSVSHGDREIQLIMRPDQSLSWRGNQYLLLFLTLWMSCFALFFAFAGAWMVLPFVGLELLALALALYYVSWKLSHRQVLEIDSESVVVTHGRHQPAQRYVFSRSEIIVHVRQPRHPWESPVIELREKDRPAVRLGEFLNREDCQEVLRLLKTAQLPTRHGGQINVAF